MQLYRIDWPNDVRAERVKDQLFSSKEAALKRCQELWGGCFDLWLKADREPGHYYCAPLHFTEPGRSSPRVVPVVQYEIRYMAGNCSSGGARTGTKWHILSTPISGGGHRPKSLCGKVPSIQWSDTREGQPATCPACLKRLSALSEP